MARRWTVAAVTCLATALLAGCSGGTQQPSTTLPTTSAPAAASPTLPPLGPPDFPVPAEARAKTIAGATAFNRYYVDLMTHQAVSLDSAPLRDLSRGCNNCDGLADTYDEMRAADQHYLGGELSITSTGGTILNGDEAQTAFVLQQEKLQVLDARGAEVPGRTHPLSRYSAAFVLDWDIQRLTWVVTQWDADKL